MKQVKWGNTGKTVPAVALGCMRITGLSVKEAAVFLDSALEQGVNFFDHADIYGGGECEKIFGEAVKELKADRETLFIQS